MKKEYIFFDLDGTLTDHALGITNSLMYALDKFDIHVESREELYKFIGPPLVDMMMQEYGFTREKAEEGLANYRVYFRDKGIFENIVYDGIPEMLAALQNSGYKLELATSKPEEFAKRILDHFELSKYFYFVGGSDMEGKRSTKDAVIAYVLESLGITDPETCIMVGDREHDVLGAKKCSMDCVGVLFGYGSREELESAGAAYIVESAADLSALLGQI